jgi:hypothetical protein
VRDVFHNLPEVLTDDWVESLPVLKLTANSVAYSDEKLLIIIRQLSTRLLRDDPSQEFKVEYSDTVIL